MDDDLSEKRKRKIGVVKGVEYNGKQPGSISNNRGRPRSALNTITIGKIGNMDTSVLKEESPFFVPIRC